MALMSEIVTFDSCDKQKCIEIKIVNDSYVEIDDKFTVKVDSLHDRIKTDPDRAVVTIENEDCEFTSHQYYNYTKRGNEVVISFTDAVLGLEETSRITVYEGGTVEVCAVITFPPISCPVTFVFAVIIAIDDGMYIYIMSLTVHNC